MIELTPAEQAEYAKNVGIRTNHRIDAGILEKLWIDQADWDDYESKSAGLTVTNGYIQGGSGSDEYWISNPIDSKYLKEYRDIDYLGVPFYDESAFEFWLDTSDDGITWDGYQQIIRAVTSNPSSQVTWTSIAGISRNTINEGRYFARIREDGGTYYLELFQDAARTNLVSQGSSATPSGPVALTEQNGSGISGTATIAYTQNEDFTIGVGWNIKTYTAKSQSKIKIVIKDNNTGNYISAFILLMKLEMDLENKIISQGSLTQNLKQQTINEFKNSNISFTIEDDIVNLRTYAQIFENYEGQRIYADLYVGFVGEEHLYFRGLMQEARTNIDIENKQMTVSLVDFIDPLRREKAEDFFKDELDAWFTNRSIYFLVKTALNRFGIFDTSLIKRQILGTSYDLTSLGNPQRLLTHIDKINEKWYIFEPTNPTATSLQVRIWVWGREEYDEFGDPIYERAIDLPLVTSASTMGPGSVQKIDRIPVPDALGWEQWNAYFIFYNYQNGSFRNYKAHLLFINQITGQEIIKEISITPTTISTDIDLRDVAIALVSRAGQVFPNAHMILTTNQWLITDTDSDTVYNAYKNITANATPDSINYLQNPQQPDFYDHMKYGRFGYLSLPVPGASGYYPFFVYPRTWNPLFGNPRVRFHGLAILGAEGTVPWEADGYHLFPGIGGNDFRIWQIATRANNSIVIGAGVSNGVDTTSGLFGIKNPNVYNQSTLMDQYDSAFLDGYRLEKNTHLRQDRTTVLYFKANAAKAVRKVTTTNFTTAALSLTPPANNLQYLFAFKSVEGYDTAGWYDQPQTGFGIIGLVDYVVPTAEVFDGKNVFDAIATMAYGRNFFFGVLGNKVYFTDETLPALFQFTFDNVIQISDAGIRRKEIINRVVVKYNDGAGEFIKESAESIAKYGVRPNDDGFTIDVPHVTTQAIAEQIADLYLELWADSYYFVNMAVKYSPHLQLLDTGLLDTPEIVYGYVNRILSIQQDHIRKTTRLTIKMSETPDHAWYGLDEYGADTEYG